MKQSYSKDALNNMKTLKSINCEDALFEAMIEEQKEFTEGWKKELENRYNRIEVICDETNNTKETLEERKIIIDIKGR